jgi:hypothetical protein
MVFDDEFVDVGSVECVEGPEGEVADDGRSISSGQVAG